MREFLPIQVDGHLKITDDLGKVRVDKKNAIHPQNMARVIARALANESNYFIKYIAFGNGGTDINAALDITFNTSNDGQDPDIRTWDSRLYNETYREIVDDSDANIGVGVGSVEDSDPTTVEHVSGPGVFSSELGVLSQITVNATLNRDEPTGQIASGTDSEGSNFDGSFVFDEIGLFTGGQALEASAGYHSITVGLAASTDSETSTGLIPGRWHNFFITVDGGTQTEIIFQVPSTGGSGAGGPDDFTYGDLCEAINTGDSTWNATWGGTSPLPGSGNPTVQITDSTGDYSTLVDAQTFGYFQFTSGTTGDDSSVLIEDGDSASGSPVGASSAAPVNLFDSDFGLNPSPSTGSNLNSPGQTNGVDAGVQNDPVDSNTEAQRMVTHLVFAPVLKAANRELNIEYVLTIAVARSTSTS